jgi:hypothetical protein
MTQIQNSNRNFRSLVGTAMLIIGSMVLLTYSAVMAWQFHAALDSTAVDSLGFFGTVGFASLRVVRAVTVDHAAVLSVLRHILVLFSAFLVTLAGIALLPRRPSGVNASGRPKFPAPPRGEQ